MEQKKKKILLFENSIFLLEIYYSALIGADYEVITADNLESCMLIAAEKPNLILIDIMTPKINGLEVLECLKSENQTKDVPVVVLATTGQEKLIAEIIKMGARGFLLKDHLTPKDLVLRINEFLEESKLTEEQQNSI